MLFVNKILITASVFTIPPVNFVGMDFEGKGIDWRTVLYVKIVSHRYPSLKTQTNKI